MGSPKWGGIQISAHSKLLLKLTLLLQFIVANIFQFSKKIFPTGGWKGGGGWGLGWLHSGYANFFFNQYSIFTE